MTTQNITERSQSSYQNPPVPYQLGVGAGEGSPRGCGRGPRNRALLSFRGITW